MTDPKAKLQEEIEEAAEAKWQDAVENKYCCAEHLGKEFFKAGVELMQAREERLVSLLKRAMETEAYWKEGGVAMTRFTEELDKVFRELGLAEGGESGE